MTCNASLMCREEYLETFVKKDVTNHAVNAAA